MYYLVIKSCMVRQGFELISARAGICVAGQLVEALEERALDKDGQVRVRICQGWISKTTKTGEVILQPSEHGDGDTEGTAPENHASSSTRSGGAEMMRNSVARAAQRKHFPERGHVHADLMGEEQGKTGDTQHKNQGQAQHTGRPDRSGSEEDEDEDEGVAHDSEPYILPAVLLYQALVDVNVHDKAADDSNIVAVVEAGEPVDVVQTGVDGKWVQVGPEFGLGWALSSGTEGSLFRVILPIEMEASAQRSPITPVHTCSSSGSAKLSPWYGARSARQLTWFCVL